jgi:hypothetical protein
MGFYPQQYSIPAEPRGFLAVADGGGCEYRETYKRLSVEK